jgi:hypothetical protein
MGTLDRWQSASARRTIAKSATWRPDRRPHRTGRELWRWTQSGIFQPTHGRNGGVADTLDAAKAAFRAAWDDAERGRPLAPLIGPSVQNGHLPD